MNLHQHRGEKSAGQERIEHAAPVALEPLNQSVSPFHDVIPLPVPRSIFVSRAKALTLIPSALPRTVM
jgi:hypothetical protein